MGKEKKAKRMSMADWINSRSAPFREPSLVFAPETPHKLSVAERRERRRKNRAAKQTRGNVRRRRAHGR